MTTHALAVHREPFGGRPASLAKRSFDTLYSGAALLAIILRLWLRALRAGGLTALAKAVVWTLIWPLWLLYLIAFVGVRL